MACESQGASSEARAARGEVVVTYWRHHHQPELDALSELIARFEAQNPGVRIDLRAYPYSVYTTKVVAAISAGEGPDLVNIHNSWMYGYMNSGLIEPVPEDIYSPAELERDFFPLLDSFRRHGAYYAVPIGAGNLALFYNRELFREAGLDPDRPPRTWSELVDTAVQLTRRDERGRLVQAGASLGMPDGQGWNYFVDVVLPQAGAELLSADGRAVAWDSPAGSRALEWYTDFITTHEVNSPLFPSDFEAFRLGLSAMIVAGNWDVGKLRSLAPDLDLGIAPLPASDDGVHATFGSAWGNAVTRRAAGPVRDAAWEFVAFLTSYENMKYWWHHTGELPMRTEVLEDEAFLAEAALHRPFLDQMPYADASLKKDEGTYMREMFGVIRDVVLRGREPGRALSSGAGRISAMLERE
jgi:multiple sugar transport system substrate-binding protein